jgi:hypothetical protein
MNQIDPQHCYIYARKSSEDKGKQVESIPRQIDIALDITKRDKINLPKSHIFNEEKTASKPGRVVFNQLMDIVDKNDHTTIYCWIFNRLSRNSKDDGILRYFIETGKLTVITPIQIFNKDTNSIVTAVEGAQGTQFSRDLGKVITDTNIRRRKKGTSPGQPPPGYKWGGQRGRMKHIPDKHRWQLINDALQLVLNNTPIMDALQILNDKWQYRSPKRRKLGGRQISPSTWYETILKNPYYYGHFIAFKNTPKEQWIQGNHKTMLTEDEFWQIQSILGEVGRTRPRLKGNDRGAYLRLLTCGHCQATMSHDRKQQVRCVCKTKYSSYNRSVCPTCTLHESKVPKERKHSYDFWFCPTKKCKQPIIHTYQIEEQTSKALDNLTIPQDFIDWAMDYLNEQNDEDVKSREAQLKSIQKSEEETEKELNRLNQLYVRGGFEHDTGEDEYKKLKKELLIKQKKIQREKAKFTNYANDWREQTEKGYRYCRDAAKAFTSPKSDYRTKREIFHSLCEKAVIHDDKVVLTIEPPFKSIKKSLDKIKRKYHVTEPGKIEELLGDTTNPELIEGIKLTWLAGSDSNRQPSDYT